MRTLVWVVRIAIFFALFAFALRNQQAASVYGFFGYEWRAPMIFIVLAAFGLGCAFGIFAMVPSWWRHRRLARTHSRRAEDRRLDAAAVPVPASETVPTYPPRDGL